jgi:hypothetical protein
MGPGRDVIELLKTEISIGLDSIESLDRKLALLPPFLGAVAALLLPAAIGPGQFPWASAAGGVMLLAFGCSILGLAGTKISVGPAQGWLSEQTGAEPETFYREAAEKQKLSVDALHDVTEKKSGWFNLALVAAWVATLLLVVARVMPPS